MEALLQARYLALEGVDFTLLPMFCLQCGTSTASLPCRLVSADIQSHQVIVDLAALLRLGFLQGLDVLA